MTQGYFAKQDWGRGGIDDEIFTQSLIEANKKFKNKNMTVRAKFKVTEKAITEAGDRITLQPVVGGSPENESFFKWTPYGKIEIGTINPEAAQQFEVGKEYYIDFTRVENVKI